MKRFFLAAIPAALVIAMFYPALCLAADFYVPLDYPGIAVAMLYATNGDRIFVDDGIYAGPLNTNVDFQGKAVEIHSINGPDNCIIDCENLGRGFYFINGESSASQVDGFTIRNGNDGYGGAILAYDSSCTITNCIIEDCWALNGGGGICSMNGAAPIITNCIIRSNEYGDGG